MPGKTACRPAQDSKSARSLAGDSEPKCRCHSTRVRCALLRKIGDTAKLDLVEPGIRRNLFPPRSKSAGSNTKGQAILKDDGIHLASRSNPVGASDSLLRRRLHRERHLYSQARATGPYSSPLRMKPGSRTRSPGPGSLHRLVPGTTRPLPEISPRCSLVESACLTRAIASQAGS